MEDKNNKYINFLFGFAVATIIWTFAYGYLVGRLNDVAEQEIKYHFEKYHE